MKTKEKKGNKKSNDLSLSKIKHDLINMILNMKTSSYNLGRLKPY